MEQGWTQAGHNTNAWNREYPNGDLATIDVYLEQYVVEYSDSAGWVLHRDAVDLTLDEAKAIADHWASCYDQHCSSFRFGGIVSCALAPDHDGPHVNRRGPGGVVWHE